MSFSLDTDQIPSLPNYIVALSKWQSTKPWRGSSNDFIRPLDKRSKKHVTIRKDGDDIICRLYRTDLVTYKPDNSIHVHVSYCSQSTERMINALLGRSGVWFNLNRGKPVMWQHAYERPRIGLLIDGPVAILDQERKLVNTKPIKVPSINTQKSAAVRKQYGLNDFFTWQKAYSAMHKEEPDPRNHWRRAHYKPDNLSSEQITTMLRDMSAWPELTKTCSNDYIRMNIYKLHPEIVEFNVMPHFENYGAHANYITLDRKYYWAI